MNIIILGPQGSGKGTQAKLLAEKYQLDHFDTGRALRQVALLNTPLGKEMHEIIMVKKELVPSRLLKEVLQIRLNDLPREQGIVFDGVPRNIEQAGYFEEALLEFGRKIDKVIFINIIPEESLERISKRFSCEKRADDTIEGVKKRLAIFTKETLPVIEYFEKKNLVSHIDGTKSIETVFANILNVV
jgi:adenylate kinase